jgi:hypothetical protein
VCHAVGNVTRCGAACIARGSVAGALERELRDQMGELKWLVRLPWLLALALVGCGSASSPNDSTYGGTAGDSASAARSGAAGSAGGSAPIAGAVGLFLVTTRLERAGVENSIDPRRLQSRDPDQKSTPGSRMRAGCVAKAVMGLGRARGSDCRGVFPRRASWSITDAGSEIDAHS